MALTAPDAVLVVEIGIEMARALHRSDLPGALTMTREALEQIRRDLDKIAMEPQDRDVYESQLLVAASQLI